jgi:hypothetical protein
VETKSGRCSYIFWDKHGRTEGVAWTPDAPAHFQLRVIDQAGRADTREVDIEFAP